MIIKTIVDEDFVNYKKPSMFIAFPKCNWKCEKECGLRVCQNSALADSTDIEIGADKIVDRYLSNRLTQAIVIGGLEPFDSPMDLYNLITSIRGRSDDDIIVYTGYTKEELTAKNEVEINCKSQTGEEYIVSLQGLYRFLSYNFKNIIIKYGRYIPNQKPHYDNLLGVYLASDNQYAEKIS